MVETLDLLAARGHRLAICTNKPERHSLLLCAALGITDRFAKIAGRETFPYCKPDGRHLSLTIEAAGGDLRNAVMVGDSKTDIEAARQAGVPVVCVPFGYTDQPIEAYKPDLVIQHFAELPAAIDGLARKAA